MRQKLLLQAWGQQLLGQPTRARMLVLLLMQAALSDAWVSPKVGFDSCNQE
jgi:hypothetical protein